MFVRVEPASKFNSKDVHNNIKPQGCVKDDVFSSKKVEEYLTRARSQQCHH